MQAMDLKAWPVALLFFMIGSAPLCSRLFGTPMRWGSRHSAESWPMSFAGVLAWTSFGLLTAAMVLTGSKIVRYFEMAACLIAFASMLCIAIRDTRRSKREGTDYKQLPPL
jgi:peptidoglycan/LPS O-acetylase OafA/YrhL